VARTIGCGTFENTIRSLTGNVYKPDGSPPSFIYCEFRPDSTGTYSTRSTSSGICQSPLGPVPIPSSSDSSTVELVQDGCELTARIDGETFATGEIAGDRIRLSGPVNSVPIEGCSPPSGEQTYTGTIEGDDLELSGEIQTEVSCEFGDGSCTLDVDITGRR
jgi:hypothetical protein